MFLIKSQFVFLLISLVFLNGVLSAGFGKNGVFDTGDLQNNVDFKDQWGILICSSQITDDQDTNLPVNQVLIQLNMGDQFPGKTIIDNEITRIAELFPISLTPYQIPFYNFPIEKCDHPPQLFEHG